LPPYQRRLKVLAYALLQHNDNLLRWDSPTRTGKLFQVTASKTAAFTTFATPHFKAFQKAARLNERQPINPL